MRMVVDLPQPEGPTKITNSVGNVEVEVFDADIAVGVDLVDWSKETEAIQRMNR